MAKKITPNVLCGVFLIYVENVESALTIKVNYIERGTNTKGQGNPENTFKRVMPLLDFKLFSENNSFRSFSTMFSTLSNKEMIT